MSNEMKFNLEAFTKDVSKTIKLKKAQAIADVMLIADQSLNEENNDKLFDLICIMCVEQDIDYELVLKLKEPN